jgi:transposase
LTDLPVAGYPLVLRVAVPRYRCITVDCGRTVFNQDLGKLAAPRASTTQRCARYVLRRLLIDRTTISAIAAELGVSWHTVSSIAMRTTADLVAAAGADRLAGVGVIGVDEHRWAPRRVGPAGFVTLIIDLTPTHDQTGPARLLDMVEGRSATALASWLAAQPASFAQAVEVIAMDGFAGYKTAATEVEPDAVTVMDPHRPRPHPAALGPPASPPGQRARRRRAPRGPGGLRDPSEDHRRLRRPEPAPRETLDDRTDRLHPPR